MTKRFRLPRIAPTTNSRLQALLPEKVQQELSKFQLSDHVVAARQECSYQFLEVVFLPQISLEGNLDYEWLVHQVESFKTQFQIHHPGDFRDFALISSIEAKLELLQMGGAVEEETYNLIQKGYTLLQQLIDKYGDNLRQI